MKQALDRSLSSFFFRFIWAHKYKCITMSILSIGWGLTESFTPYMLKLVTDALTTYQGDRAHVWAVISFPIWSLLILTLLKHIMLRATDILTEGYIEPDIKGDIRKSMMSYVMRHSYWYFQQNLSGSITNKIDLLATSFEEMYEAWEHWIAPVLWSFLFSIIIIWQRHAYCAIIIAIWLVCVTILSFILAEKSTPYSKDHAQKLNTLAGTLVNILQNIFTVKLFARYEHENKYIYRIQQEEIDSARRLEWFFFYVKSALSVTCLVLLGALIFFLTKAWQSHLITAGDIVFILTTCFNMLSTIWWISSHIVRFYKQLGIARHVYESLNKPYDVIDNAKAKKLSVTKGAIEFKDVTFTYPSGKKLFKKLSVSIKAGERIGLVGFSGSGKSTFVHLIMRFFDISSGDITIDGQSIINVTQQSLREHIALIPQEPHLFSRSVKENIAYSLPRAALKDIQSAARKARIHGILQQLPQKYNTIVGERGVSLSGGQRQRVAIARAILKDSPILILDEATSALDSITENQIQESLNRLMDKKTTLVVAHRLSTVQHMDRLFVFDNGTIIEEGNHEQLLAQNGYYAELWKMQTGSVLPSDMPDPDENDDE